MAVSETLICHTRIIWALHLYFRCPSGGEGPCWARKFLGIVTRWGSLEFSPVSVARCMDPRWTAWLGTALPVFLFFVGGMGGWVDGHFHARTGRFRLKSSYRLLITWKPPKSTEAVFFSKYLGSKMDLPLQGHVKFEETCRRALTGNHDFVRRRMQEALANTLSPQIFWCCTLPTTTLEENVLWPRRATVLPAGMLVSPRRRVDQASPRRRPQV